MFLTSRKTVAIIVIIFLFTTGIAQASDWPMFHHDARHTGATDERIPDDLGLLWSYETEGSVQSSPAIADGKVFVGSNDGKIYCVDENTGKLIWSREIGNWIKSSPAVSNGKVFVGGSHKIYCLNANNGDLIWSYETGSLVGSSPTIADGRVFVGSYDEKIYCLDENTGKLIWSYNTGYYVTSSPTVADGKVFVTMGVGVLCCLNENNGEFIWRSSTDGKVDCHHTPAVSEGRVFVGSDSNDGIYCLNADNGELIWSKSGPIEYAYREYIFYMMLSSPAVSDNKVFVSAYDKICCLSKRSGSLNWFYKTGYQVRSSPAVADGKVFVGSCDKKIYCLNENNGKLIWSYETGDDVMSSPAIADGKVFVGSDDNRLYCFGPKALANNALEEGLSLINNAKLSIRSTSADTTEAKKLLKQANTALNEGKYEDAKNYANQAKRSAEACAEKFKNTKLIINNTQSSIDSAKSIGTNTTEAEKLLKQANTALNEGKYEDAKNYAKEAKKSAEACAEKFEDTRLIINDAQSSIDSAKNIGVNITEAEKLLQQAKAELNKGKYEDAENYANQAKTSAENAKSTRIKQVVTCITVLFIASISIILYRKTAAKARERRRIMEEARLLREREKQQREKEEKRRIEAMKTEIIDIIEEALKEK